jgi:hypothetical protein
MTEQTTAPAPSQWQQRIEGEWHGRPSVFDASGAHQGYSKVYRSSTYENGRTIYTMNTKFEVAGTLQPRLEYGDFAFDVQDSDQNRIYMGPDFFGAGQPYGNLVDAHYYSPGWMTDLRTMVHILPDGETQCYSSLLYQGPTILCVFNGLYRVAFDYHSNPETKADIDAFVQTEVSNGPRPHILPTKRAGRWTGEMQVYDAEQQPIGVNQVTMDYRPVNLLRAEQRISISGVINREMNFSRHRTGNLHAFEGPDVYGNGFGYGRALYTTQHITGEAVKIKGREFLIDDQYSMSVVWQFYKGDRQTHTTYGVLTWEGDQA